jgi:hypothetical protein
VLDRHNEESAAAKREQQQALKETKTTHREWVWRIVTFSIPTVIAIIAFAHNCRSASQGNSVIERVVRIENALQNLKTMPTTRPTTRETNK